MNKTKYEVCKEKKMNKIMKEYESGKLKDRSNKKIKSRKQAVAIGLSISESSCEKLFQKNDFQKIEERFFKDLYDSNGKVIRKNKDLSYTSIKSGIKLHDFYKKQKNYNKSNKIKNDLLLRVFIDLKNNQICEYIDKSVLNELIKFLK